MTGGAGCGDAGLRWRAHGGGVVLEVTNASNGLRRELGPVAWALLETLMLSAHVGRDEHLVVGANARDLATVVGVGRDAASKALVVLRDRQLVALEQPRHAGGRFGATRYVIRVSRVGDGSPAERRVRPISSRHRVAELTLFDLPTNDTDHRDDNPTELKPRAHTNTPTDTDIPSTDGTTPRLPNEPHTLALEMRGSSSDGGESC